MSATDARRDTRHDGQHYHRRIMVSPGLGAFLDLLLVLADVGVDGGCMYGRCPECWRPVVSEDPGTLIAELLLHELDYHPEHAGTFDE